MTTSAVAPGAAAASAVARAEPRDAAATIELHRAAPEELLAEQVPSALHA